MNNKVGKTRYLTIAAGALGALLALQGAAKASERNGARGQGEAVSAANGGQADGARRGARDWHDTKMLLALDARQAPAEQQSAALPGAGIDTSTTGSIAASFFGTVAIPFSNIRYKGDWKRIRSASLDIDGSNCPDAACRKRARLLSDAVTGKASFAKRLTTVNALVNTQIRYIQDRQNYKRTDYWAPASQTVALGAGDCEDFAILKYKLLVKAGIPESSLSLVILKDTAKRVYHAVVAVHTNRGNYILDNLRQKVYRDREAPQYLPLFSFSENKSWIHGLPGGDAQQIAGASEPLDAIAPGEGVANLQAVTDLEDWDFEDLRPSLLH